MFSFGEVEIFFLPLGELCWKSAASLFLSHTQKLLKNLKVKSIRMCLCLYIQMVNSIYFPLLFIFRIINIKQPRINDGIQFASYSVLFVQQV